MNMFSRKNRKGFTLIELIVVIAILAILAAIAVPSFIGITDNANNKVTLANASSIATAYNAYQVMYPGKLTTTTPADIKKALTDEKLWPAGLPNDDETAMEKIWNDIQFENGMATVKEPTPPTT
jgi:prepilin-type N-terminal cleavage/methylation domain-containing protein